MNKAFVPTAPTCVALADPGASGNIDVGIYQRASVQLVSATTETRTVLAPSNVDQELFLNMKTDGGDITVTVNSPVDGLTTIVFDDIADVALLRSVDIDGTIRWKNLSV